MAHILIVEDEEHLAKGIEFNLAAEGYRVTVVNNGADALAIVAEDPAKIDLVILDLMLPGMSGYKVCEELRNRGNEFPIMILSARTLTEDRTRGFDVGADQYLTKPFELDELLARARGLLVRHGKRQALARRASHDDPLPRSYQVGDAQVDFDTFEVIRDGKVQQMTPLEIKLLRHLILSEGRIVSRQELLEKVWDQPPYLQTRAPDQFIRRLRKLFEVNPSEPRHFVTVRDAGYRFIAHVRAEGDEELEAADEGNDSLGSATSPGPQPA
jgi:two-component system OmpR family response regulator